MQWILQDFEDTRLLAPALERLGARFSWHKVVPFEGTLLPEPHVPDPEAVVLFGSYALWRIASAKGWRPGVFRIAPFVSQEAWHPFLLNGADAPVVALRDLLAWLDGETRVFFVRPLDDSKAMPGTLMETPELRRTVERVLALAPDEVPEGSLRHDTELMLAAPARIRREWRVWVVDGQVVTASLYREGRRVTHGAGIEAAALDFARHLVALNPGYAPAYVIDVCETAEGLRLLETNCINAAGFYAADLDLLVGAIDGLGRRGG